MTDTPIPLDLEGEAPPWRDGLWGLLTGLLWR